MTLRGYFKTEEEAQEAARKYPEKDYDVEIVERVVLSYQGCRKTRWMLYATRILHCSCGRDVALYGATNMCRCGADYNWTGQRLVPRSLWGEETGEHWADTMLPPEDW